MRYKVTVAYDGSMYAGWQTQHRNDSVQETIEVVLSRIFNEPIIIVGSGRTDRGVHAKAQVFHFDADRAIGCDKLKYALNTQMDRSIIIRFVEIVDDKFHARFSVLRKQYQYYVSNDVLNPFIRNYMHVEKNQLDIQAMKEVCTKFIGTYDFTSFTSAKIHEHKSRVKTIFAFNVIQNESSYVFTIEGNGFLRYMVRMIIQTVLMVGLGRLSVEDVAAMLIAKDKHACRYKAPACGLYLTKVSYKEE